MSVHDTDTNQAIYHELSETEILSDKSLAEKVYQYCIDKIKSERTRQDTQEIIFKTFDVPCC